MLKTEKKIHKQQPTQCFLTISKYCAVQNIFKAEEMSYLFRDELWYLSFIIATACSLRGAFRPSAVSS